MTQLAQKKCQPCEGIGETLALDQIQQHLKSLNQWRLDPSGKVIFREYVLKNFMAGVDLINRIAKIAEAENHHPNLHLTGYRKLRVELSTHALGGLTDNDFILAAKIDELPADLKK